MLRTDGDKYLPFSAVMLGLQPAFAVNDPQWKLNASKTYIENAANPASLYVPFNLMPVQNIKQLIIKWWTALSTNTIRPLYRVRTGTKDGTTYGNLWNQAPEQYGTPPGAIKISTFEVEVSSIDSAEGDFHFEFTAAKTYRIYSMLLLIGVRDVQ